MKKVKDCIVENCIPVPSSCGIWNGGDIEYLGICNGDTLNNIVWEIVTKLQEIAGEDISKFDIDTLLDICNQKAPLEITLISILELIRDNQVCLKNYIDTLSEQLQELFKEDDITVNLRCYAEFDNIGNPLSITRNELDQLVIDNLCAQKSSIDTLNGKVINLQSQIDIINNTQTVEELTFATCVDGAVKPTSSQVVAVANDHCALKAATGTPAHVASALSKTPSEDNTRYGLIPGWDLTPDNWAQNYGNLLLKVANLEARLIFMEDNCCAVTCDDIKVGFSAVFNEDMDGIILRFNNSSGTAIPSGMTDKGSTGSITDGNGASISFSLTITNNYEIEIPVSGLDLKGPLDISITAKLGNEGLTCEKCLHRTVTVSVCAYCEISATGTDGSSAVIVYEDGNANAVVATPVVDENTTSTTTTTTSGA